MKRFLTQQAQIVVVDPDPDDYLSLALIAEERDVGWNVFRSATELLRQGLPRGVLCWVVHAELPDMRGAELARWLVDRGAHGPLVIVSNDYRPAMEVEVLASGLGHYACKPIHPDWFRALVRWPEVVPAARRRMAGARYFS